MRCSGVVKPIAWPITISWRFVDTIVVDGIFRQRGSKVRSRCLALPEMLNQFEAEANSIDNDN